MVSKISADIALPTLDAVFNFIVTVAIVEAFRLRWNLAVAFTRCASDAFTSTPDACETLIVKSTSSSLPDTLDEMLQIVSNIRKNV